MDEPPEYIEPSNKQLANFLIIYAKQIPEMDGLQLSAPVLEQLLDLKPAFREGALRHHRGYQEMLNDLAQKMRNGELRCEHILQSGKQCPNYNEPGSRHCGLHQRGEEQV